MDQNKAMMEIYKISNWPRWDYEMEDSTLTFSKDGKPRVVCQMQVAGSTAGDTWQWSWSHPNTPSISREHMCVVHELGTAKQWERLNSSFLPNDEYVGWECASIASHLLGGIGVYRCPTSDNTREDGLVDAVYVVVLSAKFVQ